MQRRLLLLSFVNLLVVALLGVLLRAFPLLSSFPFTYKNILHGHSHFAFTGWVMLVLFVLLMKCFPGIGEKIPYRHWRNTAALILLSAYGMLIAFPLQGYKAVSISFSTVAIVATVYLTVVVAKVVSTLPTTTSYRFITWGLFYACLSSLGPFALGPLMAMGKSGSPLYFDAIYFYLHFQYNGFFTFFVLALLYRMLEKRGKTVYGNKVFFLLNTALVPAYALSILWHQPSVLFNWLGGAAALLQLAAVFYLLKDVVRAGLNKSFLLYLSLSALVLKSLLQVFSAFPAVAQLAYEQRNLVIAYLHLVLLGFVTLFVFASVLPDRRSSKQGLGFFLFSFFTTETLLVLQAAGAVFSFRIPFYTECLIAFSVFFPLGIIFILRSLLAKKPFSGRSVSQRLEESAPFTIG
ncbi:hypothetical protein HRH25_01210 [Flavisolibacter sp. BT320]|nr:hypothetical protein [Flavisolibacter longurius]